MLNHHKITINAPVSEVFRQIVLWGEADWWPPECPMKYQRISGQPGVPGSRWHQKVHVMFGPAWDAEIISTIHNTEISWKFLNGPFIGVYRLYIIPLGRSSEIHFLMDFELNGLFNKIIWKLFSGRKHDENIRLILSSLKSHLEGPTGPEEEPLDQQGEGRREFLKKIVRR